MSSNPFVQNHAPVIGAVERLGPMVRAVTCGNASPMTYTGTRSYIYGTGKVALIDPGPADPQHMAALLGALEPGEEISHILITHSHVDHSPLAEALSAETGAPVLGFGPSHAGRSDMMEALAQEFDLGGGEGVDANFEPDQTVADGDVVEGASWQLSVLHTPGHLSNHVAFTDGEVLFSGDHVMGWASSLVSPPDGDLTQFMESLEKLRGRPERVYYPGHGGPIDDPQRIVEHLIAHRRGRESQIINGLSGKAQSVDELTAAMYADVPKALHGAAARNVLAHLIDLVARGIASHDGPLSPSAVFRLS